MKRILTFMGLLAFTPGMAQQYEPGILEVKIISEEAVPTMENDTVFNFEPTVLAEIFSHYNLTGFEKTFSGEPDENLDLIYTVTCDCDEESLMDTLQESAGEYYSIVERIPKYYPTYTPNDFGVTGGYTGANQTELELINAKGAWDETLGNRDIKIAIIESSSGDQPGFDPGHEDLQGQISYAHPAVHMSPSGIHGTCVAGVAAAATDNDTGISSIGFNSSLLLYYGENSNYIKDAADRGAKVINLSYGSFHTSSSQKEAIDYAVSKGVVVVSGAANGPCWEIKARCGNNCIPCPALPEPCDGGAMIGSGQCETYPASYDNVVSVTSVGHINERNQGATSDIKDVHEAVPGDTQTAHNHHSKVDICAPGYNITTTFPNDTYGSNWGTSFASPMVAGVVALMFSVNPCLTQEIIVDILTSTAVNIDNIPENASYAGLLGSGRVDAEAAVLAAKQFGEHFLVTGTQPFLTDHHYIKDELIVKQGGHLIVTGTVQFAKDAKLIVEPGGKLTVDGGTLTNSSGCSKEFWGGIEVWGASNFGQYSTSQGKIILKNNAVIENANMAVRLWNPSDWNSMGGIIDASNSTFRNCRKSIEFMSYNTAESTSKIKWCTFEITDDYLDRSQPPMGQITMWDIKGVEISSSTFKNENSYFLNLPVSLYVGNGIGIGSIDAEYTAIANSFKGFYKGIDIEDYTALTGTRIQSNTFEECAIGVYAYSADYSLINGNYFIKNRITGSYVETAVGMELNGNTYNDHNEFGIGSPFVSRGMGFYSLGTQGNGFNRNTFKNGNYGVYVHGPNQGLTFHCNDFEDNQYTDVIGFGYSGNPVFTQLGSASEPLANFFTYPCTHTKSHISLNGGAHSGSSGFAANYHHHDITTEPRIEPTCNRAVSVHVNWEGYEQGTCNITEIGFDPSFSQGESPSHTDERIDEIGGVIDDNVTLLAEMKDTASGIIDNNNTQSLLNFISDGSNTSAQVAGEVTDVAPYASEEVLSACLYRDPQMEANDLFDVLVWNSPLPYGVLSDSADIYQQLEQTLYDSLWDMQSGNSPVDSLNAAVQYRQAELDRAVNLMVVTLLHDTFVVNGAEQAFSHIRKHAASDQILMPLLSAAWQAENWNVADSTLGVMEEITLYEHVYDILDDINTEIGDSDKPYLLYVNDNDFKNKVDALAADSTKYGHQVARGIVTLFTDTIFPVYFPEVEMPGTGKRNIAEQEEGDQPEIDGLQPETNSPYKLYPNPAKSTLTVSGGTSGDLLQYDVISIDGRSIQTGRLNPDRKISVDALSPGMYMIMLRTGENRYLHKIIIE